MPPKRAAASSGQAGNSADGQPDDFTRQVKKRLSSSTRTGQACDRCKVRKIRCDGLPGGCSPCMQNRTECKTTDRISQKAVPRGYLESLEAKCAQLEAKNRELHAALGIPPDRMPPIVSPPQSTDWLMNGVKQEIGSMIDGWRASDPMRQPIFPPANGQPLPPDKLGPSNKTASFRPGNSCTHYLGISAGHSYLSSMKSTALSLLGIDIDLSALDPNEQPHGNATPTTDESYTSCLASICNVNPRVGKVDLPPRDEGFDLANIYFIISHPYLPILHKPSFLHMLDLMYSDKNFTPSPAQTVMVHMIFAIVNYQKCIADRQQNRGQTSPAAQQMMERSRVHYHYALTHFYGVLLNPTLEDIQALGLVLQHLRAFPKPGGSWLLARIAVSMCIELGLHRSAKKWIYHGTKPSVIEVELRKRVFWCVLTLEVSLASKLGRPMSVRDGDYDVEYPERIDDEYIVDTGFLRREDSSDECAFDVAIEMFKHTALCIEVHSTLYGIARPSRDRYVALVEELEAKLNKWRDNTHKSISLDSPKPERRFQAAHLHSWYHECRILMRHPSLSLSPSPSFTSDCIRICVESSREILHLTDNLRKGKHYLDTTWYGATVQLLATLTILFSVWDKRETVTPDEIAQVKSEMDLCMDIMGDLGSLLGSPNRLREVVQVLTHGTMELLNQKPGEENRRSPGARLGSGSSLSGIAPGAANFAAASNAQSLPGLKPSLYPSLNDQYQSHVYPAQEARNGNGMPVFNDPVVSSTNVFEHMQANAGGSPNSNNIFTAGFSPTHPPFATPSDGSQSNVFNSWGWSGDGSWRQYMQSISNIAGELDPTETYSASALIALNQDCNNSGFLSTSSAAAAHAGAQAASALGLMNSNAAAANGGNLSISPAFSSPDSVDPPWPAAINGYTYADSAIRSVPNGGSGGGNP